MASTVNSGAQPSSGSGGVIRFVLDGQVHEVAGVPADRTVLQHLREDLNRTGTKEGCAEGDCGACTVVIAEERDGRLRCRSVNACIQFLPTLDGKALFTVESLKSGSGELHPAQAALAEGHGSQCGFCTPGFVMSLFALYKNQASPSRAQIEDALSGNLCRCTGYRPIVDAASDMYVRGAALAEAEADWVQAPCGRSSVVARLSESDLLSRIRSIRRDSGLEYEHRGRRFWAPRSVEELAQLRVDHPEARMLAGGTDVGLWVTKQYRDLGDVLYLGEIEALKIIRTSGTHLEIGAAVALSDAFPAILAHHPDLGDVARRFASPPIRNAGTLAGNIANGSPIGDSMPCLMVLGTSLVLRRGAATREIALEDFYIDYQKTALLPGEFVERVRVPIAVPGQRFRAYKISKRFDQDISAVLAAFSVVLDRNRIRQARVAFGGMAATPKRAVACERALEGRDWTRTTLDAAVALLSSDFAPIADMRASAEYRRVVAENLLRRFFLETSGEAVANPMPTQVGHIGELS